MSELPSPPNHQFLYPPAYPNQPSITPAPYGEPAFNSSIPSHPPKTNQLNLFMLVILMLLVSALTGFIGFYLGYFIAPKPNLQSTTTPAYPGAISTTAQPTTKPVSNPLVELTTPSTKQWGPESLWGSTPGKSLNYLKQNVTFTMPTGWQKLECSSDIITLNPIGGINTCETESDAFAIILAANSPYFYQSLSGQSSIEITEKRNITVGVWPAVEYQVEIIEGPYMGRVYLETVIFRNESEYVYVTLNDLSKQAVYDQFLVNLQIN